MVWAHLSAAASSLASNTYTLESTVGLTAYMFVCVRDMTACTLAASSLTQLLRDVDGVRILERALACYRVPFACSMLVYAQMPVFLLLPGA